MSIFPRNSNKRAVVGALVLVVLAFLFAYSLISSETLSHKSLILSKMLSQKSMISSKTTSQKRSILSFMPTHDLVAVNSLKYRKQRDALSRELNLQKQLYGQQSCEKLAILRSMDEQVDPRVSENGGWCADTSSVNSEEHAWDKAFSQALSKFLEGKLVASFGDGPGMYKLHMDYLGQVVNYTAYDGAPFCEKITQGLVKFLDLTAPQYGLPAFDWVVSVEVGEHIPAKYEDIYLDNLVRHAREGIVLSWAVPGQHGLSHVNSKAPEDVLAQMEKRGFGIDQDAGYYLRQASTFEWLKSNVNVYRRKTADSFHAEDA